MDQQTMSIDRVVQKADTITIYMNKDKLPPKKKKRDSDGNIVRSKEWQYLKAQAILIENGVPLQIEDCFTHPELAAKIVTDDQLQEKIRNLPTIPEKDPEGRKDPNVQKVFLGRPETYQDQEIELRLIHLKAFLENEGYAACCHRIKPQTSVDENLLNNEVVHNNLEAANKIYSELRNPLKCCHDFPDHLIYTKEYLQERKETTQRLSEHLYGKEEKESKKSKHSRTAKNMAIGILRCITM